MIKFLLTIIAVVFLFRLLLNLLAGGFQVHIVKHYHTNGPNRNRPQEEGKITLQHNDAAKPKHYSDKDGEYTDYEEIS